MYAVILTILLATGQPHTVKVDCADLVCVAYVMVAANEGKGLSRIRVVRGEPAALPGPGKRTVFPPWLDFQFH